MKRAGWAVLPVTLGLVLGGCGSGHDRIDVRTFCPLASMPHRTLPEVMALRARGAKLLGGATQLRYTRSARNERIVNAALTLLQTAVVAQKELQHPALFHGVSSGLDGYAQALRTACATH